MSHGKQFTLYSHAGGGPNGWKVAFVLEELGLAYHPIYLDLAKNEQKSPDHTRFNPNGRIPTLIDHHNGDYVLWESDAIILYLINKYDPAHKLSVTAETDKYDLIKWLFFQASGQGPYFGQAFHFLRNHPGEKLPTAIARYQREIVRVWGVLDGVLAQSPGGWLVAGRMTAADLAFFHWNDAMLALNVLEGHPDGEVDFEKQFPAVHAWHEKMKALPTAKKLVADREAAKAT
ncbi:glutathione S-transferase C-terminal-like protein [Epithele typhae]|uniref:glutathione S-transferase C-terminal-like protein n=1 Tax=Epithele typhae TaxID=378194 RepID=UPI002008B83C|nr:glutathione S-transferase C-terminal-like protein [Epithele typhae]KAH9922296.1 glutathione S-transferase C-terminal-like protein [Epithele typhae]